MLLIFSSEFDESTFWVGKWLKKFNVPYLRINSFNDNVNQLNHIINSKTMNFSSVWYRRLHTYTPTYFDEISVIQEKFYESIYQEINIYNEYLFYKLSKAKWLNHPTQSNINKIIVLKKADEVGLNTPDYLITNNKEELISFKNRHLKIIAKPIANIKPINYNEVRYIPYTKVITSKLIDSLPNCFFVSLFQRYVEKQFEIRTFFLENDFFSMAIMSQQNKQTREDFRNYDFENPNRFVPYKLPIVVEDKLKQLMEKLSINCGSIDLIKSTDGYFYFLEVNPVGQFGMVSLPCNYNLEKIIALKLIANANDN